MMFFTNGTVVLALPFAQLARPLAFCNIPGSAARSDPFALLIHINCRDHAFLVVEIPQEKSNVTERLSLAEVLELARERGTSSILLLLHYLPTSSS